MDNISFILISRINPETKLHQSARRRMLHCTFPYFYNTQKIPAHVHPAHPSLGSPDLQLLGLESRQLALDVLPRLDAGDHLADGLEDLGLVRAHLLRAIALAQSD